MFSRQEMELFMEKQRSETLSQFLSLKSFVFGIFLAVLVYFILMVYSGWNDLIQILIRVDIIIVIIAMILSFLNYLFRFMKWHLFTRSLNLNVPIVSNFMIFFAGLSLSITPAKAGEAIRAFLLKNVSSSGLSEGLASTFSERLVDLLAVTLLALFGIFTLSSHHPVIYLPVLALILLLIIVGIFTFLFDPLYNLFSMLFKLKPLAKFRPRMDKFRSDVLVTLQFKVFFIALVLGIIGWACEGLGFLLIALNLGVNISMDVAIFIYATSSLLGAVSFLPGGLGIMEGSMELFLKDFLAISTALATALIILIRVSTLWFGIAIGLIFLLIVTKNLNSDLTTNS
jgi:uncharacterized protein (TIRG00374 family)